MQSSTLTDSAAPQHASTAAPLIVFAGGGSGGHLFPALAIAERLVEIEPRAEIIFLCSRRRIDDSILHKAGVTFLPLPAQPLAWRPFALALLRFASGWLKSVRLTAEELQRRRAADRPTVVALVGGFVAAPAARAASRKRLPAVLINLDVAPGKANRLIARFATRIVSAVACPNHPTFSRTIVGMPIRRQAVATDAKPACRASLGLDPDTPTLLVTGASQGAGTFNRLLIDLIAAEPGPFAHWQVLHLTGELDFDEVSDFYRRTTVSARVMPFCDDMARAWGAADLALSRCGASSVAEALANRVPTLFSPYPWHRDQHQRLNALEYVNAALAWLVDDAVDPAENVQTMGRRLLGLMDDPAAREAVQARLRQQPPRDSAGEIARLLLAEAGAAGTGQR